jgi:long-subunit acyl-CoA synthetase (AMP-forming)
VANGTIACVVEIFAAVHAGLQVAMIDQSVPPERLAALAAYVGADAAWGEPYALRSLEPALGAGVTNGAGRVLFFTSGTTSRSKAVELSDASLMASAYNGSSLLPLESADTLLCMLPWSHVFGFVCGLLWGLSCGATVALGRGARHYLDDCAHFKPTAISVVPTLLTFLMAHELFNPELDLVLVGAGDCPDEVLQAVRSSGRRVAFGYGLTETSSGVALGCGEDPRAMTVCPDFEVRIEEDGEVCVSSSPCMMVGYYGMPEDTARVLVDGVLRTGDLGVLDEQGRLRITGRKKEMLVLSNGTKIFLPEYESDLAEALGTPEVVVTLVRDRLTLVVGNAGLDREEALRRIAPMMSQLPRGSQVAHVMVLDHKLPRTATGKVKRWEIDAEVLS